MCRHLWQELVQQVQLLRNCHRTAKVRQAQAYVVGSKDFLFHSFSLQFPSFTKFSLSLSLSLSAVSVRVCVCVCVCEREREYRERGRERGEERETTSIAFFFFSSFEHLFHLHSLYSQITSFDETNFTIVKIHLDHSNEWVILIWFTLTLTDKLGWPAQRPLRWSLHRLVFSKWVKQSHITSHLWVLKPRSTIRLSPTIRSVATETQWSRPMKVRIVYEFPRRRTTETDSGLGPSARAKRPVVWNTYTRIYACGIIVEAIITAIATVSGRKRRQQAHYRLYSKLAFCDKSDEHVAPCWKTGSKNLTGKTAAVLCNLRYSWFCDTRKRGLGVWTREIA